MKIQRALPIKALFIGLAFSAQGQPYYSGNQNYGFGGSVGLGTLGVFDSPGQMVFTLYRGPGAFTNDCVLYLDTKPGGFTDTSLFSDNGDGARTAISGFNAGKASRTVVNFSPGFGADYAISIQNSFIGVYQLVAGGNNSLNYLFGQAQSGNSLASSYSITIRSPPNTLSNARAKSASSYPRLSAPNPNVMWRDPYRLKYRASRASLIAFSPFLPLTTGPRATPADLPPAPRETPFMAPALALTIEGKGEKPLLCIVVLLRDQGRGLTQA